jgi:hypothetical protein
MAGEGRARCFEESPTSPTARVNTGAATLGLIPAPDIPEKIAYELASELPELLGRHVDPGVYWDVPVVVDPLAGSGREAPEILDVCRERRLSEGWDLAICLTDLPVYRDGRLVAGDVSGKRGVAGLSLPALGAARLQNGMDALASMRNCINTEVRFRALLTQDETQQLEVVRA